MQTFNEALKEYRIKNKFSMKDLERMVGVSSARIAVIINGGTCSDITKKKISDGLGGIFDNYVNYKKCTVCGKDFIPKLVNAQTCSSECATKRNREMCKLTKSETMADRLINYREIGGIDQKQLSELIGLSKQAIVDIERGSNYSDLTGKKVYDALGSKFKKFLKPTVCECGKVFYKRREAVKYCSDECSRKYYKPNKAAIEKYKQTQKEKTKAPVKKIIKENKAKSITEFMGDKQYGDRQREYLIGIQKTQSLRGIR